MSGWRSKWQRSAELGTAPPYVRAHAPRQSRWSGRSGAPALLRWLRPSLRSCRRPRGGEPRVVRAPSRPGSSGKRTREWGLVPSRLPPAPRSNPVPKSHQQPRASSQDRYYNRRRNEALGAELWRRGLGAFSGWAARERQGSPRLGLGGPGPADWINLSIPGPRRAACSMWPAPPRRPVASRRARSARRSRHGAPPGPLRLWVERGRWREDRMHRGWVWGRRRRSVWTACSSEVVSFASCISFAVCIFLSSFLLRRSLCCLGYRRRLAACDRCC